MKQNIGRIGLLCLAGGLHLLVCAGCGATYVVRSMILAPVPRNQGIAVVVYDQASGGGLIPGMKGGGATAAHPLTEFFEASLMEKGFQVKTLDMDRLVPADMQDWVVLPEEYWDLEAEESEIEGDVELAKEINFKTYYGDADQRQKDLSALVGSIATSWGIEHLMVVYKLGGFDYAVDIVRIRDKTVVFTYLFSGNLDGWELKFTDPPSGAGRDYSAANKTEWYHYMQLAEQVCSMI